MCLKVSSIRLVVHMKDDKRLKVLNMREAELHLIVQYTEIKVEFRLIW
jgi:hypothetical protein